MCDYVCMHAVTLQECNDLLLMHTMHVPVDCKVNSGWSNTLLIISKTLHEGKREDEGLKRQCKKV